MNSKKGVGAIMGMFVETIIIVLILIGFVLLSTIVKVAEGDKGVGVPTQEEVGLKNVYSYGENLVKLVNIKYAIAQGKNLDDAIKEVGYEK